MRHSAAFDGFSERISEDGIVYEYRDAEYEYEGMGEAIGFGFVANKVSPVRAYQ